MRSFFTVLLVLLMISYWTHIFLTYEFDSNDLIQTKLSDNGICECRCCLLSGKICESFIRQSISFKKEEDFSCHLCTNTFCIMNINKTQQCQWMYKMKANCFQYQSRQKSSTSFINLRPILQ